MLSCIGFSSMQCRNEGGVEPPSNRPLLSKQLPLGLSLFRLNGMSDAIVIFIFDG